jgi:dTMP kinase
MRGAFITFEGIEGSGKTTQVRRLAEALREAGVRALVTREPGGTPAADAVRSVLLDPAHAGLAPEAELLLYAACRADHVRRVVAPALEDGITVLCDRFSDSTRAYQGAGRGIEPRDVEAVDVFARGGLVPDVTILLDMPAEEGLARAKGRRAGDDRLPEAAGLDRLPEAAGLDRLPEAAGLDRLEAESLAFHRRVRSGFLRLAGEEPRRIWVVDARGSEDNVASRVLSLARRVVRGLT